MARWVWRQTKQGPLGQIKAATERGEYLMSVQVGDGRGARGQLPASLTPRPWPRAIGGHHGGGRAGPTGDSPPTGHLASPPMQGRIRREKDNERYFSCKRSGRQGKSEPLCMTCQTAEARKRRGRGLRCAGNSPPALGNRPSMRACYRLFRAGAGSEGRTPPAAGPRGAGDTALARRPAPGREPGCP